MFLPDPYKLDVIRFLDSAAGKALLTAWAERKPAAPDASLPHSTKLSTYDQRAGFEYAMEQLQALPRESLEQPPEKKRADEILLSTKD